MRISPDDGLAGSFVMFGKEVLSVVRDVVLNERIQA